MEDGLMPEGAQQEIDVTPYMDKFRESRDNPAWVAARAEAELHERYYHGKQHTQEEIAELQRRKQPPQTFNLIRVAIDGSIGVIDRAQTDPKAWAREPGDEQGAQAATSILRYCADKTDFDRVRRSLARDFMIRTPAAAIVELDDAARDPVVRRILPREFFCDPYSRESDFSDATYLGIARWVDYKFLAQQFDGVPEVSRGMDMSSSDSFRDRPEQWVDAKRKRLMTVEIYCNEDQGWTRTLFIWNRVLDYGPSPYLDEDGKPICPIVAQAFERDEEGAPYSPIRNLMSPQDGYNKRASKLLHMISTRQTWAQAGAVKDVDAMRQALARPDGHIEVMAGTLGTSFGLVQHGDQLPMHVQLMAEARGQIDRLMPNPGVLGRDVNGQSGIAIQTQQNAGLTELSASLGDFADLERRLYRQMWLRVRQYWTDARTVRIIDQEQAAYLRVNEPDADGNVIEPARLEVDIMIDVQPEVATLQSEQFGQLVALRQAGVVFPPELYIQASQLRDKAKLLQMLQEQQAAAAQPGANPQALKGAAEVDDLAARTRLTNEKATQIAMQNAMALQSGAAGSMG